MIPLDTGVPFNIHNSILPSNNSLSSRLASRLSFRNCRSISALIRFCSFCSSDRQQAMVTVGLGPWPLKAGSAGLKAYASYSWAKRGLGSSTPSCNVEKSKAESA